MREIKFRGKTKDKKEWVYGDLTQSYPKDFPPEIKITWWVKKQKYYSTNPVDKETIGQYTGLKDKNEKEIYEGDIVRISNNEGYDDIISEVEWGGQEYPAFDITSYDGYGMNGFSAIHHSSIGEEIEVIGNIHENKYLLELLDDSKR